MCNVIRGKLLENFPIFTCIEQHTYIFVMYNTGFVNEIINVDAHDLQCQTAKYLNNTKYDILGNWVLCCKEFSKHVYL